MVDPTKTLRDRAALERKIDEAAHVAALEEFRSGVVRSGLMAKAIIEANVDEDKAKAVYPRLLVESIKDDMYIAHRVTQPKDDSDVLVRAVCSLIIPGFGQFLQGRNRAGRWHIALALFLWRTYLGWTVHLWSMFDAAKFGKGVHNSV